MKPIVILGNGPMTAKLIEEVDSSDQPWCVAGVVDHAVARLLRQM